MRFAIPLLAGLLAVAALMAAMSCDRRPVAESNTLRFINRGDIFTLDLNDMSYAQDIRLTYAIREGLYAPRGPDYTPQPAGATGCDISADQKTYTFHLRDSKWSNGDPVVAGDYVFSWRLMLESPGEYTYLFHNIAGAEAYEDAVKDGGKDGKPADFASVGIAAVGDHTLRVTLRQPVTYFLDLTAFTPFFPRNQKSMEAFRRTDTPHLSYDSGYTRPPNVVTNGPFVLTDWQFKKILHLQKNLDYWDAANVKLDAVEMIVNDNLLSEYLQFTAGAVDWLAEVPADIAPELLAQKLPEMKTSTSFGTAFLTLNCAEHLTVLPDVKNPLADVRVRQAMAMAIDKKFIVDQITRLNESVATTYVPPGTMPGYVNEPGLAMDVVKAKQLLAAAGYPGGAGFPKLPILYNTENATRARIVQALKQQWKQALGIDVEIEGIEGKIFHQRISTHNFVIAPSAWYGDYPDPSTFTDKYAAASEQNDSQWFNTQYNDLLTQAAAETDVAKRYATLEQAEHLINTEVPLIPMYHYVNTSLISGRVSGIAMNPRSIVNWKDVAVK